MCCSLLVWAQNTVTGTVLDESNLEVIGANVKEKGTANGAITDMNGVFHLKVSNLQKAVLQISFMGYEPQEVPLNSCLLYTSPSPRDRQKSRMPSSA